MVNSSGYTLEVSARDVVFHTLNQVHVGPGRVLTSAVKLVR